MSRDITLRTCQSREGLAKIGKKQGARQAKGLKKLKPTKVYTAKRGGRTADTVRDK